mmetsp:Transcript_26145/g.86766  ORF Transcript_26145/g.86766 Transcript_26145/m.86766 type:complete len:113 (+) Transcript_26145:127-465(+)
MCTRTNSTWAAVIERRHWLQRTQQLAPSKAASTSLADGTSPGVHKTDLENLRLSKKCLTKVSAKQPMQGEVEAREFEDDQFERLVSFECDIQHSHMSLLYVDDLSGARCVCA